MEGSNNVFQCLLQDIGVSKDLNEHFRKHLTNSNEPLDIDFSIQVLSSGSWPFQQSLTFSLPTEVCVYEYVCVCVTMITVLVEYSMWVSWLVVTSLSSSSRPWKVNSYHTAHCVCGCVCVCVCARTCVRHHFRSWLEIHFSCHCSFLTNNPLC